MFEQKEGVGCGPQNFKGVKERRRGNAWGPSCSSRPAWPSAHPLFFREFSLSPSSSPTIISWHNVLVSFQQPSLCFLPLFGYLICSRTFPSDCKLTEGRCFWGLFFFLFLSPMSGMIYIKEMSKSIEAMKRKEIIFTAFPFWKLP